MKGKNYLSKVVMNIIQGCLVVPIHGELYDESVLQIQRDVLEKIKNTGIKKVIIDLSGANVIDSFLGQVISDTVKMASMLGATTVLTGFKPEVVVSLIDLDFDFGDIQTAITLEDGFHKLQSRLTDEEIEDADDETTEAIEELEEPEEEEDES